MFTFLPMMTFINISHCLARSDTVGNVEQQILEPLNKSLVPNYEWQDKCQSQAHLQCSFALSPTWMSPVPAVGHSFPDQGHHHRVYHLSGLLLMHFVRTTSCYGNSDDRDVLTSICIKPLRRHSTDKAQDQ